MFIGKDKVKPGFTIVELLIVVVIIAILATITVVAYNGVTTHAKKSTLQSTMSQLHKKIETYAVQNGEYPKTQTAPLVEGSTGAVLFADENCSISTGPNTTYVKNWIPGLDALPQSKDEKGINNQRGCYIYQSDGNSFVLSAWNMVPDGSSGSTNMYRRLGFRERAFNPYYLCNHNGPIGGINGTTGVYSASLDIYKHSYTISNITNCNETPPS